MAQSRTPPAKPAEGAGGSPGTLNDRDPGAPSAPRRRDPRAGGPLQAKPGSASIWSAGWSATPSSAASTTTPTSISPLTPAPTTSKPWSTGWADAVWDQGRRFGTIGLRLGTRTSRDHHPPGRGLPPRQPQAGCGVRGRHRGGPVAARFHRQRHGAVAPGPHPDRSFRRGRRPGSPPAADPARARGVVHRRSPPHAAGRPLHRRLRAGPGPRADRTPSSTLRARLDIVSDERIRDELDKLMVVDKPGDGLWFLVRTGLAEEFLPELPALALEQDPIHRHKDVLAHTVAVVENTRPVPPAAPGGAVPRRRQTEDPVVWAAGHGDVPPPRGGRGPHDPRPDEGPALLAATTSRPSAASSTSTCASTPTGWAGPTAPSAATCATPGRSSTCSTS